MSNTSRLSPRDTQIAIKTIKDFFQINLSKALNLYRVTAPLFVRPETGLNDNLSGVEKAVSFTVRKHNINLEIVQSLAKWKRRALLEYGFHTYEGIYTDMNAIRADESLDEIHSVYVDQWDWEVIIKPEDRNETYLEEIVKKIYGVFKQTEAMVSEKYPQLDKVFLPDEIFFIRSDELLRKYPGLSAVEREAKITEEKKAVFIIGIGEKLENGEPHGSRSPDYDDWDLNGDILFWNPVLNAPIELSSMGIRVNADKLKSQLGVAGKTERLQQDYHQALINGKLPQTVGGGIGQSRICMFFLQKQHIGEVQCSIWDTETIESCERKGIHLL